jgi:hypothetical protein
MPTFSLAFHNACYGIYFLMLVSQEDRDPVLSCYEICTLVVGNQSFYVLCILVLLYQIRVNMDGSASSQSRHLSNRNRLGYLISQRSPSPPRHITPGLDSYSDNENNNKTKDPNIITRPASR